MRFRVQAQRSASAAAEQDPRVLVARASERVADRELRAVAAAKRDLTIGVVGTTKILGSSRRRVGRPPRLWLLPGSS
ncbi:hypothetical protein CcI49_22700 [Frankia sp. CcI49]|nr:hypothetical protein ACG83_11410 [Frankia sp. R43]ONH58284.1 hypothetical protein CcI49_22700 [Frankia sp. CcI49]